MVLNSILLIQDYFRVIEHNTDVQMYLIPFLSPCLEEFLDCLPLALDWDRDCEAREADLGCVIMIIMIIIIIVCYHDHHYHCLLSSPGGALGGGEGGLPGLGAPRRIHNLEHHFKNMLLRQKLSWGAGLMSCCHQSSYNKTQPCSPVCSSTGTGLVCH